MAASRASSLRALKQLSNGAPSIRKLHMTGPATFPSPILTSERPVFNLPRDIAGLKAECEKRRLPTTGSQADLTDRLTADELVKSRGFSTAARRQPKRPTPNTSGSPSQLERHFNTSRALKAVNDSSTIDFAYLPDFDPDMDVSSSAIRVPLLPQNMGVSTSYAEPSADVEVSRRTIVSATDDASHISSPASIVEGDTLISEFLSFRGSKPKSDDKSPGMAKELWDGLMDDIFPTKHTKA